MIDDHRTLRREPTARSVRKLRLSVTDGPDTGRQLEPIGRCAVGTATDNELVLADPLVSRYHLELAPDELGVRVKDLGSSNGTHFGAARVVDAIVPPGSHLVIGGTTLRIDDGGSVARARAMNDVPSLVGTSPEIREIASQISQLAGAMTSTLIQGETGTGKELVARAIHDHGPRRTGPFVVVDCGSMPATLIASELFGHERGAFTGADQRRAGAFEQADGGTLFLDEIGELPLAVQPVLLGALERRRFRRVGGSTEISVDVRVVAATNRDLRIEANRGSFRPDLYFRLAVARLVLPSLRERSQDIEPLVAHFVEQVTGTSDVGRYFGPQVLEALRQHPWSGNVRELRNVVERALTLGQLKLDPAVANTPDAGAELLSYRDARAHALAAFEREYCGRLIALSGGNASEAARRAAMDRPYLLSLLKKHGLR